MQHAWLDIDTNSIGRFSILAWLSSALLVALSLISSLVGCKRERTQEALVRECQQRGGVPNVEGEFKCEMDKKNPYF